MSATIEVLYVEDDPDIRTIATMALEDEGFHLVVCESGQDAMEKATSCKPDLLLLDVMMPGMDGPATLQALRRQPHLVDTPVIFMTAKVQSSEVADYRSLGALGIIRKPFDPMSLEQDIRRLLDSQGSGN